MIVAFFDPADPVLRVQAEALAGGCRRRLGMVAA
jgi:hypothetical protein